MGKSPSATQQLLRDSIPLLPLAIPILFLPRAIPLLSRAIPLLSRTILLRAGPRMVNDGPLLRVASSIITHPVAVSGCGRLMCHIARCSSVRRG